MYRRRRPQHNRIAFSFDSFLDVVTNVIGIIIRLILVTWVGARAYTAAMMETSVNSEDNAAEVSLHELPAPRAEDDPVSKELLDAQLALKKLRNQLTQQLKDLDLTQTRENETRKELVLADGRKKEYDKKKREVEVLLDLSSKDVQNLAMTKEELIQKAKKLQEDIQAVAKLPTPAKALRYHTPVSRPVRTDIGEYFFECKRGRVSYIDKNAFKNEIDDNLKETLKKLESNWKAEAVTSQIGAFRLRYFIEREREFVDSIVDRSASARKGNLGRLQLAWVVEPMVEDRGETIEAALKPGAAFRQVVDGLDAQLSVVTLWVYPDSFDMFRRLRDFLHDERDIEVAGRPIPFGLLIGASPYGTASRGQ
jgi:vacuolar-type H+-ATPase subunit I/STV1